MESSVFPILKRRRAAGLLAPVQVYLNGKMVAEELAVVSVFDRGFLYGDGIFETVRAYKGRLFLWEEHMARWERGVKLLGMPAPWSSRELRGIAEKTLEANGETSALVRLTLSRGRGTRGYSPSGAISPTLVVSIHPAPARRADEGMRTILSRFALSAADPLARTKHASKLLQVLARAEADSAGADEALLSNGAGHLVEGTSANLFWFKDSVLRTSPLSEGALPGTFRGFLIDLAGRIGIPVAESITTPAELRISEGAFLCSTGIEMMEIAMLDGYALQRSPLFTTLQRAFVNHVDNL